MAGIISLPRKDSFSTQQDIPAHWKLVKCPVCGAECYESNLTRYLMNNGQGYSCACTICALKSLAPDEMGRSEAPKV